MADKKLQKIWKKIEQFLKNKAKICKSKMLKPFQYH